MENENVPEMYTIIYHITQDQAEVIAKHFGKELSSLEEYEVCELLDRYIDELN